MKSNAVWIPKVLADTTRCTEKQKVWAKTAACGASHPRSREMLISAGGRGAGWLGSGLAPKVVSHGLCDLMSPAQLGPYFGCLVSQPPRLLMIPELHQGVGEREIPLCLCVPVARTLGLGGGGFRAQG